LPTILESASSITTSAFLVTYLVRLSTSGLRAHVIQRGLNFPVGPSSDV
jgi:hypothetical protein